MLRESGAKKPDPGSRKGFRGFIRRMLLAWRIMQLEQGRKA
jgi:hypothetical protein